MTVSRPVASQVACQVCKSVLSLELASDNFDSVFLFAGQSNALSTGSVGTPTDYGTLDSSIKIWNGSAFQTYNPATNSNGSGTGGDGGWGPEASFAKAWRAANPTKTMYIVKLGQSDTGLYVRAGVNDWNVSTNELYLTFKNRVNAALATLPNPRIRALLFMQGETDADAGAPHDAAYTTNLSDLIEAWRSDFATKFKVVLGRIHSVWGSSTVRTQQRDIASSISNIVSVSTDYSSLFDSVHYNTAGIELLGQYFYSAWKGTYSAAPTDIAVTWGGSYGSGNVPSNTAIGATIATLSATNTVCGGSVTFSVVSADSSIVTVSGSNLLLNAAPTQGQSYSFTLRVTNNFNTTYDETFTLTGAAPVVAYTTLNQSDKSGTVALSNGNLTAAFSGTNVFAGVRAVNSASSGKYYFEAKADIKSSFMMAGLAKSTHTFSSGAGLDANLSVAYWATAGVYLNNTDILPIPAASQGDVICIAVDLDARKLWVRINGGNWNNSGTANPATDVGSMNISSLTGALYPLAGFYTNGNQWTFNFGASAYTYSKPSGFSDWPGV